MNTREVAVVAVVVLLGVAGVALPTVAATTAGAATQADETNETATGATANESGGESAAFGEQMTAFMQSSAAETNDTVESGMWQASFERANESRKARLAHNRTDTLADRLQELRERNRTLSERYENGSLSRSEYVAKASELSGRIASLRSSIDETDRAAERAGVNESRLDDLREDARNVSGPQTAGVARGVVAGSNGPPADRGNRADGVPGNGVGADAGNRTGDASAHPGNGTGPPDSAGRPNVSNGGGNANPSDGGVGTGASNAGPGEASSGNGNAGGTGNDGSDSGDGVNPGNGNGASGGSGNSGDGEEDDGDDGDAGNERSGDGDTGNNGNTGGNGNAGNPGNGNNDYTWLVGFVDLR